MDPLPLFSSSLKALFQLDPASVALNALYRLGLQTGHYRRAESRGLERLALNSNLHSLFVLPDRAWLLKTMGKAGQVALFKEADEIVKGRVRLFGAKPVPLRLTFGRRLRHWSQYQTHKAQSPISKSTDVQLSDIKFVWEPARFGWAFSLGRAYHVSGKEKYAEAFWKYFREFDKGNPPYQGPNWMNGQEVAIRLMALVWSAQVFAAAAASTAKRRDRLAQAVAEHASRIPPTLIYARSQNNNHLLVEAAGLYTAGLALRGQSQAWQWRMLGQRWLNWCFTHQIGQLGEYVQHSTNYHRLILQVALWLCGLSRDRRAPRPPAWLSTTSKTNLRRAAEWLLSMTDPESGRTPNLGANDGSLLLPLSSSAFDDYRPTVQAACRAFLGTSLPPGPWDEFSLWLDLPSTGQATALASYTTDPMVGRNSHGYLRASSFKSRLSHMDQLHFDLWWGGLNIAQDPGTYLYNAPAPWDNPFVSSRVHNTVTVDGYDQMTRGGRFLTLDWFPAYSSNLPETESQVLGRRLAHYAGYKRLGVSHERAATALANGHWHIRDDLVLTRAGEHIFRLHWLLPDWKWKLQDLQQGVQLRMKSPQGTMTIVLRTSELPSRLSSVVSLVRSGKLVYGSGSALPFEGWASPTYGVKVPALSLSLELASSRSVVLTTEFILPK